MGGGDVEHRREGKGVEEHLHEGQDVVKLRQPGLQGEAEGAAGTMVVQGPKGKLAEGEAAQVVCGKDLQLESWLML